LFGSFKGAEHNSEARIARNIMVEPINVKVCMLSTEANPFLDEVEVWLSEHPNQRVKSKT
jgi:hypothetical protein